LINSNIFLKDKDKPLISEAKNSQKEDISSLIDIEKIIRNSYEEGFEKGRKTEEKEVNSLRKTLEKVIKNLEEEKKNIAKETEEGMVKMALAIAKKIIKKKIDSDSDIIVAVAAEALRRTIEAQEITIKVNPLDWMKLKQSRSKLLSLKKEGQSIQIERDENIERGGCIVETEKETIDARIDYQMKQIEKTLLGEE